MHMHQFKGRKILAMGTFSSSILYVCWCCDKLMCYTVRYIFFLNLVGVIQSLIPCWKTWGDHSEFVSWIMTVFYSCLCRSKPSHHSCKSYLYQWANLKILIIYTIGKIKPYYKKHSRYSSSIFTNWDANGKVIPKIEKNQKGRHRIAFAMSTDSGKHDN